MFEEIFYLCLRKSRWARPSRNVIVWDDDTIVIGKTTVQFDSEKFLVMCKQEARKRISDPETLTDFLNYALKMVRSIQRKV